MNITIKTSQGEFTRVELDGVMLPHCVGVEVGENDRGVVVNITCLDQFEGQGEPMASGQATGGDPMTYLDGSKISSD